MTTFFRLLADTDKAGALTAISSARRNGEDDGRIFEVSSESFRQLPGAPFAYWAGDNLKETFVKYPPLETKGREARRGPSTGDDFRRIRLWYEVVRDGRIDWRPFAKGGVYSPFYVDVHLLVSWDAARETFHCFFGRPGRESEKVEAASYFFRPGLTWPLRTTSGISPRAMPRGGIFGHKGPAAFVADDNSDNLLALLALINSRAFGTLVSMQLAAADAAARSYEVGIIQKTPVPIFTHAQQNTLATLARRAWSLGRTLDTVEETSHAFVLPAILRCRMDGYDPPSIEAELVDIQTKIDEIAFDLYGFGETDRAAALGSSVSIDEDASDDGEDADDSEDEDSAAAIDETDGLLSWAAGVAFGRFDWRLATGEREAPLEPEPFDPLPAKSPGMLPDGDAPFHTHHGILVDDQGHPHDLPRLVEEVLARVDAEVPGDVRRWLQRDFFPLHLKQYSKSRRKAPIYWPLSTASGGYTLWLCYHNLSSQTLYTAVNDFVEPKLKQVDQQVVALRNKGGARTREDEKNFEAQQAFELELIELRDNLLQIAPTYRPNHDDGVQISAAPLWPLFRHRPWQKLLKETWAKLEKGDYDWAHLAMAYWPDRVREKCKTDKSLAIAHDLEELFKQDGGASSQSQAGAKL